MSKYNFYVEGVSIEAVLNKLGGVGGAKRFLSDELRLVEAPKPEPPPEPVLDFIVRVDRSVKPKYPSWTEKVEHPELECSGPTEYDLQTEVEQWFHDDQKNMVVGNIIYKQLQKDDALATCLNLQDGLSIAKKGIVVFRSLFGEKSLFLWRSVVQQKDDGHLFVPYICDTSGMVVVCWGWLGHEWGSFDPALCFK